MVRLVPERRGAAGRTIRARAFAVARIGRLRGVVREERGGARGLRDGPARPLPVREDDIARLGTRRGECAYLLVPVCLSASHIAYGSIRMEPVFFALGQVAGTAAAQALADGRAVQDVDYGKLRERLVKDGMVIE